MTEDDGSEAGMALNAATPPARGHGRPPDVISGLSRQNSVYRRMIAVCDQVADAALSGSDAQELTRVFARTTGKTIVLLDPALGLRACEGAEGPASTTVSWNPDDAGMVRVLRALAAERRPLRVPAVPGSGLLAHGCVATPIAIDGTSLGYLLMLDKCGAPASNDVDLLVASFAATLFALTLAHERTSTDLGLRYQGAVVDALVSGHFLDAEDARRKALSIGLPSGVPYRIGVVRSSVVSDDAASTDAASTDGVAHRALEELVGQFAASARDWVVVVRGHDVVTIMPETVGGPSGGERRSKSAARVLADLAELVRGRGGAGLPTSGLSEPTARPDLAPQAMRQAEHALDLGLRIGRAGEVIAYDDLGVYRLLLQIGDLHQLWQFADDVLGPLIEYDATHKLDLVRTLSVYLSQHASLKQSARVLRVHANTISYRMHRIEQLTPLDLADPDDRLLAHVAVKIVESRRAAL